MSDPGCQLYLITPPHLEDPASFAGNLVEAIDAGGVACVQLRLKEAATDDIRRAIDLLRPLVQDRDVSFILNDDPALAAETGCDGVHVGQQDTPYAEARRLVGDEATVGVTCHGSRDLAMEAAERGADYVAFGAFFPSTTKDAKGQASPDILRSWSEFITVPSVAIGGITPGNCGELVRAGADFLAVVSAVWDHPDGPAAAVKFFNDEIARAQEA